MMSNRIIRVFAYAAIGISVVVILIVVVMFIMTYVLPSSYADQEAENENYYIYTDENHYEPEIESDVEFDMDPSIEDIDENISNEYDYDYTLDIVQGDIVCEEDEACDEEKLQPLVVNMLNEDLRNSIDSISRRHGAVGVQVAVIHNGEILGTHNFGYATRNTQPMSDDIMIRTASLTKPILAMAILGLADEGVIDIDEDIGEYWGMSVRNPNRRDYPISIRQMLTHTSSINDFTLGFRSDEPLLREQFRDGTIFRNVTPGTMGSWLYSNFAYTALGVTIEIAIDETVNSIATRLLFAPLEIDAAFGSGSVQNTDMLATLYTSGGGVGRSVDRKIATTGSTLPGETGVEFSGGLTISALDLAQLLAVLINDGEFRGVRILSSEAVEVFETIEGTTGGFQQLLSMRQISGLFGEEEIIYHTGSNFGVFALMSYNPINGNGVVVLTTGARDERNALGMRMICVDISKYIYEHLRGEN